MAGTAASHTKYLQATKLMEKGGAIHPLVESEQKGQADFLKRASRCVAFHARIALYCFGGCECAFPQSHMAITIGIRLSPLGVREYSTFGGT